jgi:hypothetical protein
MAQVPAQVWLRRDREAYSWRSQTCERPNIGMPT